MICPNCFSRNVEKLGRAQKDRRRLIYQCADCQTVFDKNGTPGPNEEGNNEQTII